VFGGGDDVVSFDKTNSETTFWKFLPLKLENEKAFLHSITHEE